MSGYRPITDLWLLTRAKLKHGHKYYGAYPGGFLERARALLGVTIDDPVLHACAGRVRDYPYARGFGRNDRTLDLDPAVEPDFLCDARTSFPLLNGSQRWSAVLMDPPYTAADADKYFPGRRTLPTPNQLVRHALAVVRPGGRIGILHYLVRGRLGVGLHREIGQTALCRDAVVR